MIYRFFASFLVYSQIWLNLRSDDCHFFCIFLWTTATLAKNKNSPKKNSEISFTCFDYMLKPQKRNMATRKSLKQIIRGHFENKNSQKKERLIPAAV
jgi:hypothetical protein